MNISIVSYIFIFLVAFFPAYLGYQEQHAWVGYVFTIGFALSSYIPFLRDYKRQWWIALVVLILFGYTIESIGVLTCLPYGCFAYSNQLWPKLLGIVPRLLAFTRPPLVIWVWQQILRLQHLFAFTTWDHDQGEKELTRMEVMAFMRDRIGSCRPDSGSDSGDDGVVEFWTTGMVVWYTLDEFCWMDVERDDRSDDNWSDNKSLPICLVRKNHM